jgi:glycosyltransferase involved in cell wall biosynthesis
VVPGAVDVERFHPGVDGSAIRREQAIPGEALVLGMIARIKPGRRHDLLLDAFRRLADPRIYLAFIGKGEGHAALAARVAELHLEDRVRFYGFRDHDLPEAIRSLDVSILLAEGNDASCRAVLESMAAGVPVIGVAFPAIADAIDGSGGGISVPPDDEAALVRALSDLVGLAPGERAAMGARARERAVARHSDRTRAEAVLAFYERIRARRVY